MSRGFTLIELMIGLTLVALLLMLALPSFSTMLANQKLRAQAESIANGLQTARAEAVKRNVAVQFVTTDDNATIDALVNTLTPGAGGQNWVVRATTGPAVYEYVEGKNMASGAAMTGSVPSITFNGLGQTDLTTTATYQVTSSQGGLCVAVGGSMRCLNVTVSPGGQVRMCDPSVTAAGDTRKC
jgi:type IV fimbrial biogenesis protein FimT